jgi:hypothetical protein
VVDISTECLSTKQAAGVQKEEEKECRARGCFFVLIGMFFEHMGEQGCRFEKKVFRGVRQSPSFVNSQKLFICWVT